MNIEQLKQPITDKLAQAEMQAILHHLWGRFADAVFQHRSGGLYIVRGVTLISADDVAKWGFTYHTISDTYDIDASVLHSRPLSEFLDGRFTLRGEFVRQGTKIALR